MWDSYVELIMFGIEAIKILPTIILLSVIMALKWLIGGE